MRELPSTNAGKSHGNSFARLVVLVLPALPSLVLHADRARLFDSHVAGLRWHHEPVPHTHALVLFALAGTFNSFMYHDLAGIETRVCDCRSRRRR